MSSKKADAARGGPDAAKPVVDNKAAATPFMQWVYETFLDQLRLPEVEGGRKYHEFLAALQPFHRGAFELSGAARVQKFHTIKFGYPVRPAGYTVGCFTAEVPDAGPQPIKTIYAYAFWPAGAPPGAPPEYVCAAPTYESRDGEFRNRLHRYEKFCSGYELAEPSASPIEACVLAAVGAGALEINVAVYPPAPAHVDYCDSARLGLRLLASALLLDVRDAAELNMSSPHVSKSYKRLLLFMYERGRDLFGREAMERARAGVGVLIAGYRARTAVAFTTPDCGLKITTLTAREALQAADINFAPWREIWAGRRAADLVVNRVGPMFPIYGGWTILAGVDRALFENSAMHERFDRSVGAAASIRSLRAARAAVAAQAATDYRSGQLDAHIYDAMLYAQDYIRLTDAALVSTSEYVGQTLRALPASLRSHRAEVRNPRFEPLATAAAQAKYLFDLCYGAHALHTRAGVIHTDLHLNNMTFCSAAMREPAQLVGSPAAAKDFTVVAYIAGPRGEADTYVFPHVGPVASIIDFSRVLVGPGAQADIAAAFGAPFAAGFFRGQVSRALRALHHYAPDFTKKNQEAIKGFLLARPDAMFRIMSAVDFLAIGRNVGALFREIAADNRDRPELGAVKLAPEGAALAAAIERIALEHLVLNLTELIGGGGGGGGPDVDFAGARVLPGAFGAYRYAAWAAGGADAAPRPGALRDAALVDAYNLAAPLEYSSSDYARFPPWARFDALAPHLGALSIRAVTEGRTEGPFLRSLEPDGLLAVLQETVRREVEEDGEPAAAETSSWLAD